MIQIPPLKPKRKPRVIEPVKLHPSRGRTALSRWLREAPPKPKSKD
ncbi:MULTISPECIES: hypothetical protein [Rhodobacter]|uniref:Uncharacterized protein n=2 Tax=Rhodobacter TaxID=1060 RepID=A0A285SJ25_9RHOB|nr:hypothetical protein [Rhodobacter maris]SOC07894.1 hypothetical protein SAMN05877831_10689 [Rhodobacter maris]